MVSKPQGVCVSELSFFKLMRPGFGRLGIEFYAHSKASLNLSFLVY